MKKSHLLLTMLSALVAVCVPAAACATAVEYSLDRDTAEMTVGETVQLTVTSSSEAEFTVAYSCDNEAVATVTDAGLVTAVAEGTATVTAEVDGNKLTCAVTVSPVTYSYSLNKTSVTLEEEETVQLSVTSTPVKQFTVRWTSASDAVATVNQSGLVTAVAEGTTTVKAAVDGKELTCAVTVEKAPSLYTYTLNHAKADLEVSKTLGLELTCAPEREDLSVTWASADETIATVSAEGVVTALKKGKVAINAVVDGQTVATCEVNAFVYEYSFEKTLTLAYTDKNASIPVTVTPAKPINISYVVNGTAITVDGDGAITVADVGTATVTIKDGETVIGACGVTVQPVVEVEKTLQLHVGDVKEIGVTVSPEAEITVTCEVAAGDAVTVGNDGKTLTAVKNGSATVKITAGGKDYECSVLVNDVNASADAQLLTLDRDNPYDITDGSEYWEQYISNEVNHKLYDAEDEDLITISSAASFAYLSDYKAFLAWHGGANKDNCSCGKCDKDSQNGGDGGWTDGGNKALCINQKGGVITLAVKVFAGESTINVYTGGYNLVGRADLKAADGAVIATASFDNKGVHKSHIVTFALDVKENTEVTVELTFVDDYNDAGHSVLSLAAASVSGNDYRLKNTFKHVISGGTAEIEATKDGVAVTEGVTCEIVEGGEYVTVSGTTVTGVAEGTAKIKVTVDGRVRYFTVEVGDYNYSLVESSVLLKAGETYQIEIVSDPVGSASHISYESADTAVATVSNSGLVTAVANGSTTVTASVDGKTLTFTVNVSDVTVTERHEDTAGKVVDLTSGDIIYWEHYLYDEINPMDVSNGGRDLIDGSISGKSGDPGSSVKFYFAGSSGPKENSLEDGAFHKYSRTNADSTSYRFEVTVPAGTHEIRVYTGVWESTNKTSLWDGAVELGSYEFGVTSNGAMRVVVFTVTNAVEKTLTLKIEAVKGNNCRLSAIAIADTSITAPVTVSSKTVNAVDGNTIDFTAANILDWATFGATGHEKDGGGLILTDSLQQGAGAGTAGDYKGSFNLGDTTVSDFKFSDEYVSVNVKVTANVKKLALYVTGWNADYFVQVRGANGKVISSEWVNKVGNQSVAKEFIVDIDVTEETTLTLLTRKMSTSNCGIAGVALYGAEA